jgi:hypothetical protein
MRPAGEVRAALLHAISSLCTPDRGPTLNELAREAQVGYDAARRTIDNMKRGGDVIVPRTRKVDYRNKPVAEYAPASMRAEAGDGFVDLGQLMGVWR